MEITQQTVTMIINGVFAFFLVMGFMFGAARGFRKSSLRLVFIVSIAAIMYLAAPYISGWLLNFDLSSSLNGQTIDINGTPYVITTINELINTFLASSQTVQDFVTANPSFQSLVEQLPAIMTNLVVFLAGFWAFKIITWPIYAIMASGYNKKDKEGNRPKKHRLGGAFIGVAQGVVIALITFMPIAGFSSIINVDDGNGTGTNLLGDFLPPEISDFLPVSENSAAGIIGGIGSVDERVFDGLTTITVKDEDGNTYKIAPRQELETTMSIMNDVQALIEMVEGIQDGTITEVDWDLLEELIDKVFDLNTLELLIEDYAPELAEEAYNGDEFGFTLSDDVEEMGTASAEIDDFIDTFIGELTEANIANFKSDALAIVGVGRALDNHGVVDLFFQIAREEITDEELGERVLELFASNSELSQDIMTAIFSSHSVKTLLPKGINIALAFFEEGINEIRAEKLLAPIVIDRINGDDIDWTLESETYGNILHKLVVFANSIDPFNLGDDVEPIDIISNLEISELGEVINMVRGTQLFGGVYSSIVEAVLTLPQVDEILGDYIDVPALINALNTTDWAEEFDLIEDVINLYTLAEANGTLTAEDIAPVIERLETSDLLPIALNGMINAMFLEAFEEETVPTWANDINLHLISGNAEFFSEFIEFILFVTTNDVENLSYAQIDVLVAAIQSVNTSDTLTALEIAEFKGFFNNLIHYAIGKADEELNWTSNLNIDDFIDNIDTVAEILKLVVAMSDESFIDYTPAQVDTLIAEIAELDNMSPELAAVLQGVFDDFMLEESEIFVPIIIENIVWADEGDILKDVINLYLTYENDGTLDGTLAGELLGKLDTSYVANTFFNTFLESILNEETTPAWLAGIDLGFFSNNPGLTLELVNLGMFLMDNDEADVSIGQIADLTAEIALVADSTQDVIDAKAYLQSLVDSLGTQPI